MTKHNEGVDKPNCYDCKWRGDLPGDAHSCCRHPANAKILNDPAAQVMALLGRIRRAPPLAFNSSLQVTGNPHGIRSGWFNWPMNFDPVWLQSCNGFEAKATGGQP